MSGGALITLQNQVARPDVDRWLGGSPPMPASDSIHAMKEQKGRE